MEERRKINFFAQLPVVFGIDGYAITPELLEYVAQNPHIGSYNWNAGLQAFQPSMQVDNALKNITQDQIEQLNDRNNQEPIRIAEGVNIRLNPDGTININGINNYFFYKTPKSRIEKSNANNKFDRRLRRILRDTRDAVFQETERAGGAMALHEDEELTAALDELQIAGVGGGGGVAMVLDEGEGLAGALENLQIDEGRGGGGAIKKGKPGMFGGKSRRRKSRKSNKSKKHMKKNLKKSKKNKK